MISFLLDERGRVETCEIMTDGLSGVEKAEVCARAIGELGGKPAKGPNGEAVYGVVAGMVMRTSDTRPLAPSSLPMTGQYLTLTVSGLPDGAQSARVPMLAYIDAQGNVTGCRPVRAQKDPLFDVACSQSKQVKFETVSGADGKSVGHVDTISVIFEVDSAV